MKRRGAVGVVRIPISHHSFRDCACQLHSVSGIASDFTVVASIEVRGALREIPSPGAYLLLGFWLCHALDWDKAQLTWVLFY